MLKITITNVQANRSAVRKYALEKYSCSPTEPCGTPMSSAATPAFQHRPSETHKAAINDNTGIVIGDNRWHHIAATFEETPRTDGGVWTTVKIYKDFAEEPSWEKTVPDSINYGWAMGDVWLGASSSTETAFTGLMDEIRISNGVLEPSEFMRYGKRGMMIRFR